MHEPRFSDADTETALERAEDQATRCPQCGHPRDEVWPRDADHALELDSVFYAEPLECIGCKKIGAAQKRWQGDGSAMFTLRRRDEGG